MEKAQQLLREILNNEAFKHVLVLSEEQIAFLNDLKVLNCALPKTYIFKSRKEIRIEYYSAIQDIDFATSLVLEGRMKSRYIGYVYRFREVHPLNVVLDHLLKSMNYELSYDHPQFDMLRDVFCEMLQKALKTELYLERRVRK